MAAVYGDDFVYEDNFSDFSDFEDECNENIDDLEEIETTEVGEQETVDEFCCCGRPPTRFMITCVNGSNCKHGELFHYRCVGMTKKTLPKGNWTCPDCLKEVNSGASGSSSLQPSESDSNQASTSTTPTQETTSKEKKKRKIKPKLKRPEAKYTLPHAVRDQDQHFLECLQMAKDNKSFKLGKPGRDVIELAGKLLPLHGTSQLVHFKTQLTNGSWKAISSDNSLSTTGYDKMFTSFNSFSSHPDLRSLWSNTLSMLGFSNCKREADLLMCFLTRKYFEVLAKKRNNTDSAECDSTTPQPEHVFTQEEQQTIRYIAGYIPFALLKKYEKMCANGNVAAGLYVNLLNSWKLQGDKEQVADFLAYTNQWIDLVNRGGLYEPNDQLFLFFRCVESVVILKIKDTDVELMRDGNMRDYILGWVLSSVKIKTAWHGLVKSLTVEYSETLKRKMLEYWVVIRCHGYVKTMSFLLKQAEAMDKKGAQALRSTLHTK